MRDLIEQNYFQRGNQHPEFGFIENGRVLERLNELGEALSGESIIGGGQIIGSDRRHARHNVATGSAYLRKLMRPRESVARVAEFGLNQKKTFAKEEQIIRNGSLGRGAQGSQQGLECASQSLTTVVKGTRIHLPRQPCQRAGKIFRARFESGSFRIRFSFARARAFRFRSDKIEVAALYHFLKVLAIARRLHFKHFGVTPAQTGELVVRPFLGNLAIFEN